MKNIAVILSGCGYLDGAEITEAVSALISLDRRECNYKIFAPDMKAPGINHRDSTVSNERNVFDESARIARGKILKLKDLNESEFDGIVFPGGFGVAKNFCDWATQGSACQVDPWIKKVIVSFFESSKPILAICIAPALIAKVLGHHGVTVTIGNDPATAKEIEKTGAIHENCEVTDFVTDRATKVISTPAYMYETSPHQAFTGISKAIDELVEMA